MRYAILVSFLVFAATAMAEMKPAVSPATASDSVRQTQQCMGHPGAMMPGKADWGMANSPMAEKWREHRGGFGCMGMCPPGSRAGQFMMHHPRFHRFLVLKALAGMFLLLLTVNVLLTIIVSLDMKQRQAFKGLWIPLLLIAGIPTAAIYALFRIGDNINLAAKKQ